VSRIAEVALFTDELGAAVAFYLRLLQEEPEAEWPGGAIFAVGNAKLLVHERSRALDEGPPNDDHFALGVADVDAACARLREEGVFLLVEPRDYPWGRSAYLRDPDGRLVELSQE
jgi:lactoylglutathione lyase